VDLEDQALITLNRVLTLLKLSSSIEAKLGKPQTLSNEPGSRIKTVENGADSVEKAGTISLILD
jgi:hypothetical protein